jgi:hypothetical protein
MYRPEIRSDRQATPIRIGGRVNDDIRLPSVHRMYLWRSPAE